MAQLQIGLSQQPAAVDGFALMDLPLSKSLARLLGPNVSSNLTCFLFGLPATFFWIMGIQKGIMLGLYTRWVRRSFDPTLFWIFALFYGSIALGLWIAPILSWLGLRE